MPITDPITLHNLRVVATGSDGTKRRLRIQSGDNVAFTVTELETEVRVTISGTDNQARARPFSLLNVPTGFQRSDGTKVVSGAVLDIDDFAGTTTTVQAVLSSTGSHTVRARLWDTSAQSYVSGTAMTTTSPSPTIINTSGVTLASGQRYYEVHVDTPGSGSVDDAGVISFAAIRRS